MTPLLQDDEFVVFNPEQVRLKYVVRFSVEGDQLKEFSPDVNTTDEPFPPPAVHGENCRTIISFYLPLLKRFPELLTSNVCLPASRAVFRRRGGGEKPSGGREGRTVGQLRSAGPPAGRPCEVQADGFALSGGDASLPLINPADRRVCFLYLPAARGGGVQPPRVHKPFNR